MRLPDNTRVKGCPWRIIPETVFELAEMYSHYDKGFLWWPGAMGDQPPFYAEAMQLFANTVNRMQAEEMEKATRMRAGGAQGKARNPRTPRGGSA